MFSIGNVPIHGQLVLAPMAAVSDSPYRQITRSMGSAFSYTEFVSADQVVKNNPKSLDMFRFQEIERPIAFQIFGNHLVTMVEAAKRVEELHPDIIDVNMGCSSCKIAHKGSGAGLLREPGLAGKIIESLRKAVKVPITAKIRIGWDAKSLNYKEVVKILESSGVQAISVHGRTKAMGYGGKADWNIIAEIKAASGVPILGNGDIQSYTEAMQRIQESKVDAVLVGRGAIGNPWIFQGSDRANIEYNAIRKVMQNHLDNILQFYGEYGYTLFKKHIAKYLTDYPEIKRTLLYQEVM
jgi:tRNA-dihydrouridine synthase B